MSQFFKIITVQTATAAFAQAAKQFVMGANANAAKVTAFDGFNGFNTATKIVAKAKHAKYYGSDGG